MTMLQTDKVEVPCPDCGQLSLELLEHVRDLEVIPCSICGGLIDLSAENCRTIVEHAKSQTA